MHGLIFFQIQKYAAELPGGRQNWTDACQESGLDPKKYSPVQEYPDEEAVLLLQALAQRTGKTLPDLLETFGEFLAPQLVRQHPTLVRPEWRTLDLIANSEEAIHTVVRMRNPGARPPVLTCARMADDQLQLIYASPRKLCALAKGMVRGVARHYGESVELKEDSCMLQGDPFCALQIRVVRPAPAISAPTPSPAAASHNTPPALPTVGPPQAFLQSHVLSPVASPPGHAHPRQVAHYQIVKQLGQGGMGAVYLAEDTSLQRQVALKVMHAHLATDLDARLRFLREARMAASLHHDHIVTVFQVGQDDEVPFLAMQYLEGVTLEEWLTQVPEPPLRDLLRIGREIATGLAAAHQNNMVHRDIKPSNIWLEGPGQRVKILDFGLARSVRQSMDLTQSGVIVGTPAYISPEQATGKTVDRRTDLFSLGVILYRMSAGRLPFLGDTNFVVMQATVNETARDVLELNPDLPRPLGTLIMQLLAKDPADRPNDAGAVVKTLQSIERKLTARHRKRS